MTETKHRQTEKKTRTREHIICDLSANYVELRALECDYSTERRFHDYGIDMNLYTYNNEGEIENGFISLQLKATDNPDYTKDKQYVNFPVKKSDLKHWLKEIYPVILIMYDAGLKNAYWVYLQDYFEKLPDFNLDQIGKTITVKIKKNNRINKKAIQKFAFFKNRINARLEGVITHA